MAGTAAVLVLVAQACRLPDLPDLHEAERRVQQLSQTSFIYARDGTLITTFHGAENRTVVPFRRIPQVVRDAVVAIEDRRFYEHKGVDLKALIRAAYIDATSGKVVEGGSTITEQYVKNRFLGSRQTLSRKVREAVLAWQLEHRLSKDEILMRYLNTVYFGQGAYGIQAAAKTYFSKAAADLDLPQASLLAGLIAAPSALEPIDHPGRARARRSIVLRAMLEGRMISPGEYRDAANATLELHPSEPGTTYAAPYFVQFVKEWVASNEQFGATRSQRENLLYRGGLRIYTTLSPRLQAYAEEAISQILIYKSDPRAAMTVIDPRTGEIKAMVGGRDFFSKTDPVAQVNLATGGATGRQAGSSFKPFALVAALENGIAPDRRYDAPPSIQILLPQDCQAPGEPVWDVQNYDGSGKGSLTVEQATVDSVNVVYAQIVRDLGDGDPCAGAQRVVDVARRLGVNDPDLMLMGVGETLNPVPASVLGAEQVNTVEMALAYSTLANMGYRVPPVAVTKITDTSGRVLYEATPRPTLALDPPLAWLTDQILGKVVTEGTGLAADIGRPAIGKTGTAQEWRDAWFVGAIPQLAAAVWVGFPRREVPMVAPRTRLPHVLGGTWPAQIWHAFMVNATEELPVRNFPQPTLRYVTVRIDSLRNCVANQYTPPYLIVSVQYLEGTQPTEACTEPSSYQPLDVPSVIGLIERDAVQVIENSGFASSAISEPSDQPVGTVIAQSPAAGKEALQASTITITVAAPSPSPSVTPSPPVIGTPTTGTVPDVMGQSQEEAIAALQDAGYAVAVKQAEECDPATAGCEYKPGVVWREKPPAGAALDPGATVTVWVNP